MLGFYKKNAGEMMQFEINFFKLRLCNFKISFNINKGIDIIIIIF